MLCNGVVEELTVLTNSVELDLLGSRDVLGDDHGVVAAHHGGCPKEALHLAIAGNDAHGSTTEHVRRPHEHRESNSADEVERLVDGRELGPLRLVDAQLIAELAELEAVLACVDRVDRGAENLDGAALRQAHGQVVRRLSADRDNHTRGLLQRGNVKHSLVAQLVEVEPVGLVVVGGDRLWVAIDDDGLVAQRSEALDARDRAPVELHAAADPVGAATQHDDARLRGRPHLAVLPLADRSTRCCCHAVEGRELDARLRGDVLVPLEVNVVLNTVVGQVEVVGLRRELGRQGVDLLHHRRDVEVAAQEAHVLLLDLSAGVHLGTKASPCTPRARRHAALDGPQLRGDLAVREATALGLVKHLLTPTELGEVHDLQTLLHLVDVVELGQEPAVNARKRVHLLHALPQLEGLGNRPNPHGRRLLQLGADHILRAGVCPTVLDLQVEALGVEACASLIHHAQRLLDGLLEVAADGHDLADTLHRGADGLVHRRELAQVPPRHLGNNVVEGRLEASSGAKRDTVAQLHEVVAQGELRGHVRQRVTGGLRGQGTAARQPGIDLDDAELLTLRVDCVLDVALPDDAKVPHHLQRALTQAEVLGVGECLRGGDDDGVTRVDAHRVEVLHVADRDAVVVGVTDHLVLKLLPTLQALVDNDLWAVHQGGLHQSPQLRVVVGKAAAQATQGESRAH
mmetsp:Transcript_26885/g.61267  ORF Transcript_26885/g.61267 Transcript_26885/m.61267 type:complete len:685 (+) Transcript_26885:1043-3097(+)